MLRARPAAALESLHEKRRMKKPDPNSKLSLEQALDELDALVQRMESGALTLDDSIAAYRRGTELARLCQTRLTSAELEIRRLEGEMLKPVDPDELKGGGA